MSVHDGFDCTDEMDAIFEQYNALKGRKAADCSGKFWDAVVFSVGDVSQRKAYETQIQTLKEERKIPLVDYIAVEDDPTYKMGSGGATMHILTKLKEIWGDKMFAKKILLIHTGGQCRRLPQHSAVGKLFARLTRGRMLEVKLAMYLPFCEKMTSGMFLTASDDIETFVVDGPFTISNSGFTVLAHPSKLSIAKDHGVYVLPESKYDTCANAPCLRVLQKPTMEEMQAAKAFVQGDSAFTDSAYVLGVDVMQCLLEHYEANRPLNKEICAYGDLLTCLGSEAPDSNDPLKRTLRKFSITAIVLTKSNFYHIGTLTEYLDNLCSNRLFKKQLGLGESSCIEILSRLPLGVTFNGRCVFECCDFSKCRNLVVGNNCILWGCQVQAEEIKVPDNVVMFTVPVMTAGSDKVKYVTLCFGVEDDLKTGSKLFNRHEVGNLWEAKLFQISSSRSESFLSTLEVISEPKAHENFFSMEGVLKCKYIRDVTDFERTLVAHWPL